MDRAALFVAFLVSSSMPLRAQSVPASITFSGTVYDADGPAIPDAPVTFTRSDEATEKTTATTSRNGEFQFAKLTPGHYSVDVTRSGYAGLHIDQFDVQAGDAKLNVMLPQT